MVEGGDALVAVGVVADGRGAQVDQDGGEMGGRGGRVAVTVTVEEPDRRRSRVSGPVTNPALSGVGSSMCAAQSVSPRDGSSVKVSVPRSRARPRRPTPGSVPSAGCSVAGAVPLGGQVAEVTQRPGWRSMSAMGSRSMPLS